MSSELARAAGIVAAAGLAALLVAPTRTLRLSGLAAWALGSLALADYLAPKGHAALLAGGAVAGLVLAAAGAALLLRWPWLLALATLACVPARIPVTVGSTQANLLVPLYGVVAAAALALAWELVRGDTRARELGPVALPLAAFVAWGGLSLAWSQDVRQGAIELLAFYLPFGLLAVALARLDRRRLDGTDLLVLAIELPGADRRRRPGRGARVGPARAAPGRSRRGRVRARRRGGAERAPCRPPPRERRAQPRD